MGKHRETHSLAKLKLIIYTRSSTRCSQYVNKDQRAFSTLINNVEGLRVRKICCYFPVKRLLISCDEISFFGHYFAGGKEIDISKRSYCPEEHIKKRQNPGFSTQRGRYQQQDVDCYKRSFFPFYCSA